MRFRGQQNVFVAEKYETLPDLVAGLWLSTTYICDFSGRHTANTLAQHRLSGWTEGIFPLPSQNNWTPICNFKLNWRGIHYLPNALRHRSNDILFLWFNVLNKQKKLLEVFFLILVTSSCSNLSTHFHNEISSQYKYFGLNNTTVRLPCILANKHFASPLKYWEICQLRAVLDKIFCACLQSRSVRFLLHKSANARWYLLCPIFV